MRLGIIFILGLLALSACSSKTPRMPDQNWSTLNDKSGKPLAAFSTNGEVEFYAEPEAAVFGLLGVLNTYSKECPCAKDCAAKPTKAQPGKKEPKKVEAPKAAPLVPEEK